jgi:heat shock protein HslJ
VVESPPIETRQIPYVDITSPAEGALLDSSQPISVRGMGAGLFEGTVVVEALDASGNRLALQSTILNVQNAGMGAEGPWQVDLMVTVAQPTQGQMHAYAASPKDGSIVAEDRVAVTFSPSGQPAATNPLEGITWVLVAFSQDEANSAFLAEHQISAFFDPVQHLVGGTAACNSYSAEYALDGERISLGPAMSTLMACDEPRMTLETLYLATLGSIVAYQIESGQLILSDLQGTPLLVFRAE